MTESEIRKQLQNLFEENPQVVSNWFFNLPLKEVPSPTQMMFITVADVIRAAYDKMPQAS